VAGGGLTEQPAHSVMRLSSKVARDVTNDRNQK
jgi:hypothetical protein